MIIINNACIELLYDYYIVVVVVIMISMSLILVVSNKNCQMATSYTS
jgi:hypothetical protein